MSFRQTKKYIPIAILGLSILGLMGVLPLVQKEFSIGNICPQLFGIPACYIIIACLIFILVSELSTAGDKSVLYFLSAGVAALIALFGSIGNLFGFLECPKTESGIPMCYISLGLFLSLIFLKWQLQKGKVKIPKL